MEKIVLRSPELQYLFPMANALEIQKLTKEFNQKPVVDQINLEIKEGEIFGLLGPNGAGKSTTINMVTGVTNVTSGSARVFGYDTQKDFIHTRRLTGVMHQEIVVDTFFTIEKALEMHSGYYGVADDKVWRGLLIERLALGPHLKKSMNKLSGGMKRRFMVAKALIHKPRLLILDEPTAGVDVELRQNLWEFVREMNKKEGTTVLLTTHYLEEAEEMCARVAIMNFGKVVALDGTQDLMEKLNERRLKIHVTDKLAAVPANLKDFDCELDTTGHFLEVKLGQGMEMGVVLQKLADACVTIKEVETKSPSLQDAFLKLTSRNGNGNGNSKEIQ